MSEQVEESASVEAPVMPEGCPDENALAELVQGLLDDVVAGQIEVHLDGCEECRRIVSSVGQSSYLAARRTRVDSGRAQGSQPATTTPMAWGTGTREPAFEAPLPGTILAGKYRVDGVLGQGGMGVVLAATHLTLGKLVALKLMRPDVATDKGASQRFVREARAASLLRSEHIVRVIDLDTLDDGSPYIAMEYLEGEDLGAMLVRGGAIGAQEAATYIVQVCEAIAEAHAANIVHRDLKPANLFLTRRANTPCVKVLDFGVSKIIAGGPLVDDVASTDTKSLVGSPHYMAPEQLISAKSVDPRTDIWALGCILFELVAGRSPFATGGALAQVLASILRDNAPSLHDLCPELPAGFIEIVERCLQKDPSRRYQRVDELAAALVPFATMPAFTGASRTTAVGIGTPPPMIPVEVAAGKGASAAATTAKTSRRTHAGAWLLAAALLLIVAGGYAGYRAMRTNTVPVAQPAPTAPTTSPPAAQQIDTEPAPAIAAPQPPSPAAQPIRPAPASEPPPPAPKPARKKPADKKKLEDDLIGPSFK